MSLQLIAKQMEAKGRKGDSMLVHMTPGEVAGLQKLAESAGGSLSVNPETGLVEANFLKRMLPTLVGLGVGAFAGPLAGAAAGALVGGVQAKDDDQNVGLGALMGGLGGYGGASIGAGIGAAGSTAAQAGAMQTAAAQQAVNQATAQGVQQGLMAEGALVSGAEAAQTTAQQLAAEKLAQEAAADMARREAGAAMINQAGETAAKDFAAQGIGTQASQGIQALAGQPGRDAFMSNVGMEELGMAAAPMMAPGERPGEAPVDDEMYSYTYNPGRTGAERTPTSSTAERKYFDGRYSPVRKIRASEYGFAEGGEATATDGATGEMSGASKAAFDYLMGNAPSSTAGLPALAAQAPASQASGITVGSDNMYAFDPATGVFVRNQNYVDPASGTRNAGLIGQLISGGVGGGSDYTDPNPGWTNMSDAEKAAYYAENPTMAGITQFGQNAFNFGTVGQALGRAQDYFAPGFRENQELIAQGIDPMGPQQSAAYDYNQAGGYDPSSGQSYAESVGMGGDYGYSGYSSGEDRGEAAGGLITLAKGGMASGGFVVPADVVSALGNGSTDAGLRSLNAMLGKVKPIKGKGDGLSDSIPTHIDGKQPARVADGEAYIDPKTVKRLGGAKKLYAMMDKVRAQAHGKTSQQRKVNPAKVMA